ncbi:MAG: hypothetical protein WCT85_00785 [Parachlamydiales bacterium]|jgi:hypothetical protein
MYKLKKLLDNGLDLSKTDEKIQKSVDHIKTLSDNFTTPDEDAQRLDEKIAKLISLQYPDLLKEKSEPKKPKVTPKKKPAPEKKPKVKAKPRTKAPKKPKVEKKKTGKQRYEQLKSWVKRGDNLMKEEEAELLQLEKKFGKSAPKPKEDKIEACKRVLAEADYRIVAKKSTKGKTVKSKRKIDDSEVLKNKVDDVFTTIIKTKERIIKTGKDKDEKSRAVEIVSATEKIQTRLGRIVQKIDKMVESNNLNGLEKIIDLLESVLGK